MAILFKEKIDDKLNDINASRAKELSDNVNKAQALLGQLYGIKQRWTDLLDTLEYCYNTMPKYFDCAFDSYISKPFSLEYGSIMIDKTERGFSLFYRILTDYKSIRVSNDKVSLYCNNSFNGHKYEVVVSEHFDFGTINSEYVKSSIYLLEKFINSYDEFESKILKIIKSL